MEQGQTKDFTKGPILGPLLAFSMPILLDLRTGAMLIAPVGSIGFKASLQYFGIER